MSLSEFSNMNRDAHILIGVGTAILIVYLIDELGGLSFLSAFFPAIIGSGIGSLLPDLIEPAIDYKHRGFFHSKRMLKYLVIPLLISFPLMFFVPLFDWVFFGLIGYEMHLIADSTTTMGLPE